ncbi:MAG TPA: spermidine/putrescine ABC transporter substrate-binding protein [Bdellovibrionota bacterium]|nr:spermidine/putrescine ABC transporter substrate-binding protein [Bdellovibrionota bacterium]
MLSIGKIKTGFLGFLAIAALGACTKSADTKPEGKTLRVLTWSEYFKPEVVGPFETKTGIKVQLDFMSNNEELLAKVQASVQGNQAGYDLILPTDYMVTTLVRLGLIKAIDKSKVPVLENFDKGFLNPEFDPGNSHSVPFAWGTTGLAIFSDQIPAALKGKAISWKDFFENPDLKGKVTLLDDQREVIHSALLAIGKQWSTATEADITAAFAYLKKNKAQIKAFVAEGSPAIEAKDAPMIQAYSGDVITLTRTMADLRYVLPSEGATLWTDNFAIPVNGQADDLAYQFINAMLEAQGAAVFTNSSHYLTPNLKALGFLDPALLKTPGLQPTPEEFKKLHYLTDRPELLTLIDRLWTELKTL